MPPPPPVSTAKRAKAKAYLPRRSFKKAEKAEKAHGARDYCQGRGWVMPIYLATDNYSAVALRTNVGAERVNLKTVGGEHIDEAIKARGWV
ncbi:hypothetical protein VCV18_009823 [Metarhizium anisopliae]